VDFGTFFVESLIVHDVPRRRVHGASEEPTLSDAENDLNTDLRNFFKERITTTLSSAAFDVIFDRASTSPIPDLVQTYLGNLDAGYVDTSKEMANHLYNSQTAVNSPGRLTVVSGTIEDRPCIAILKLEKEEGVRVRYSTARGLTTFNIEHLRELMLTEATKVFKAALFRQTNGVVETIEGRVSDNQRGYDPRTEVATFFLKTFLGCELKQAPDVSTKRFLEAAQEFINERVGDPEKKARYHGAVLAELNSQRNHVDVRDFVQTHLERPDRAAFETGVRSAGVTQRRFRKDVSLVRGHIRQTALDFASGISMMGRPEVIEERVHLEEVQGGTRVEFVDELMQVRGK
jgi:hypothetical protein